MFHFLSFYLCVTWRLPDNQLENSYFICPVRCSCGSGKRKVCSQSLHLDSTYVLSEFWVLEFICVALRKSLSKDLGGWGSNGCPKAWHCSPWWLVMGEQVWGSCLRVAPLTGHLESLSFCCHSTMSDTLVPSTARSTLAIDWDSETRSLYYDEQESEVGHSGFGVSALCWFLLWRYSNSL